MYIKIETNKQRAIPPPYLKPPAVDDMVDMIIIHSAKGMHRSPPARVTSSRGRSQENRARPAIICGHTL